MRVERFEASRGHQLWLASRVLAISAVVLVALAAVPASAATLDRIRETGSIKFGYLADARPFSFKNDAGAADGYSVALCQRIAEQVKSQLGLSQLAVEWVPVTMDSRLGDVQSGGIDLLCTPTSVTLSRRQQVAFSIPVFAGGNRAVLRADSAAALRDALAETPSAKPVWRGSPAAKVLKDTKFAVVSGTTAETWLKGRSAKLQVDARILPVADYRTGLQQLRDGKVDVFFGDRTVVLGAIEDPARENLVILDRQFTHEQAALALARGDDDFRQVVDSALSQAYASSEFGELYAKWCGRFDDNARAFFRWNTLAE
jgi:polar amino acid transport system substrate-binding protein